METLKLFLQFIGVATLICSAGCILLFVAFYKTSVVDYVDEEMEEVQRPLTIDDLVN